MTEKFYLSNPNWPSEVYNQTIELFKLLPNNGKPKSCEFTVLASFGVFEVDYIESKWSGINKFDRDCQLFMVENRWLEIDPRENGQIVWTPLVNLLDYN